MSSWNEDDLAAIAESHDLHVSPFREDGITYGTPTLVWPLVVDGEVYVRAANGQQSSWYAAALKQVQGQLSRADHAGRRAEIGNRADLTALTIRSNFSCHLEWIRPQEPPDRRPDTTGHEYGATLERRGITKRSPTSTRPRPLSYLF